MFSKEGQCLTNERADKALMLFLNKMESFRKFFSEKFNFS